MAQSTLDLAVDREGDLPVGAQLAWRIRGLIASGRLSSGQRLPSVRELARLAGVHVNTARAVYSRLEGEGVLRSTQGLGTFVADGATIAGDVQRIAVSAVTEARDAGFDPDDLIAAVYAAASTETVDQRTLRDELRRQIGHLETELAAYARELPRPEPQHPLLAPKAHVADVGELERIRNRLIDQLADAQGTAARRGRREDRARAQRERMARDPGERRWQWVSNEEVGERACGTWHVTPQYGPLGALMGWWRVKISSGCPLPGAG